MLTERTLADLGFPEIRRALNARARTAMGRENALALAFLEDVDAVRAHLRRIEEARRLIEERAPLPLDGLGDIRPALERAGKGGSLEPKDLVQIAQQLFSFIRIRESLHEQSESLPLLFAIAARMPNLEALAARVDRCFEASGEISDRASPELREARQRCRGLHRSMKTKIEGMLHDEKFLPLLREAYFTIRNGRYVFPVLAQRRAEVPGLVHNASQTGQTLFVEPDTLISQGNDLAIAESVMLEEERRILQELSAGVGRAEAEIRQGVEAVAELDAAEAAARLAVDLGAATPAIEEASGSLDLIQLRHPLLLLRGREVVANDVTVAPPVRAMVISGPNAGGKTATLTATGLCTLMLRAGLQIPADPRSRLPLYRSVHSIVGDAQDLSHDLSTFSGHVEQLRQIGAEAQSGCLVLIDEIAADTNPREGAALAMAVLEDLVDRGATVLVTTHLEELKSLPHMDPRFLNASVGFDSRRLAPTYRLRLGAPGTSSAIDIAARAGLPASICQRARELSLETGGPFSKALAAVEEEQRALADQTERARIASAAAEAAKAQWEEQRLSLERERLEQELAQRQQLKKELESGIQEVRQVVERVRAEAGSAAAKDAQRVLEEQAQQQGQRIREVQEALRPRPASPAPPEIRVGGWVHHQGLGTDVEILDINDGIGLVSAGLLKTRVPLSELSASHHPRPKSRFRAEDRGQERSLRKAAESAPAPLAEGELRCDVRGLRLEDAVREVEIFLDRAFQDGRTEAVIVHGHGTGALKRGIRELLAQSRYLRMYRPGDSNEGGDGVTWVAFRQ